jgi:ABC-type uncharacterized transport system auxiliary subunit
MKHALKIVFSLFIILFIAAACLGPKKPDRKIDYYTLEYEPPKIDELAPLPFVLRINRFQVAPLYNSNRIVFSEKQFRRDVYIYHKWRANPGDLVTYFLTRDLKQSSIFNAVFAIESTLSHTHLIEGTVEEFFEHDGKDSWEAVLGISITLIATNEPDITKRILFQKKYLEKKACMKKNPRALAEAMSKAMAGMSEMIIKDVHSSISNMDKSY